MKKALSLFLLAALSLLPVSCVMGGGQEIMDTEPFRMKRLMDDGKLTEMQFDYVNYVPHPADIPGCCQIIAGTKGTGYDYVTLSICFYDNTVVGKDLKLERVHFAIPFSSNSGDYANTFTGNMYLKLKSGKKAVIRMRDVSFMTDHGEFMLDGDLEATLRKY